MKIYNDSMKFKDKKN